METTKKLLSNRFVLLFVFVLAVLLIAPHKVDAKHNVGAHTARNSMGDTYLGGNYLELGISKYGYMGTLSESIPGNFHGLERGGEDSGGIAITTNPAGFGNGDLNMDFTMPGSPEDRWVVGYKIGDDEHFGSNSRNDEEDIGIKRVTVKQQSKGKKLQAQATGTFNNHVQVSQTISFNEQDKFFKNVVSLKNVSYDTIDSVRFMNSLDPDNTVDLSEGAFSTTNTILNTFDDGDDTAAVMADTSFNNNDPVYLINHTRSPIILVSGDSRSRVFNFGFNNDDPYDEGVYDDAQAKGFNDTSDTAIGIIFDVGTMGPDETMTFTYYTSVDNRGGESALNMIRCGRVTCPDGTAFPGSYNP